MIPCPTLVIHLLGVINEIYEELIFVAKSINDGYKALANAKTTKTNLLDTKLFECVTPYSDLTPVKKNETPKTKTEQIKKVQEIKETKKTNPVKVK